MCQAIRQATQDQPIAVWLLGRQERQLNIDQFVFQDGRTYRTQEKHNGRGLCRPGRRDPGRPRRSSYDERETNGWKSTPASFLEDIQKACVEMECPKLPRRRYREYRHGGVLPSPSPWPGGSTALLQKFGHPRARMTWVAVNGPLTLSSPPCSGSSSMSKAGPQHPSSRTTQSPVS